MSASRAGTTTGFPSSIDFATQVGRWIWPHTQDFALSIAVAAFRFAGNPNHPSERLTTAMFDLHSHQCRLHFSRRPSNEGQKLLGELLFDHGRYVGDHVQGGDPHVVFEDQHINGTNTD